ncbi:hypothetical protein VMCG_01940 [Cytospora schulzeri]|uniref:5'-hydroxyaverantin dehydrogenase n=1 Tax=Cytospora schulzeri TaxID=448051 RepID=A0A423X379_9PEZI|nr:hypothetical protein VMCG_01940 [Valsa malicola]
MAPLAPPDQNRLVEAVRQSPPVDLSRPYDPSTLRGKTILVTGGSSGLGAAFARHWAAHGANLIVGDINDAAGEALVAELRANPTRSGDGGGDGHGVEGGGGSGNDSGDAGENHHHHHHFVHVDVTSWSSQAALFQQAARLSPTGHLDAVVASAGISDRHGAATGLGFENPSGLDAPEPPAPDLRCIEVNLIGMMYTAHLALFWLQQDGRSPGEDAKGGNDSDVGAGTGGEDDKRKKKKNEERENEGIRVTTTRDRHFLMIGSYAGLTPCIPGVPEYVTSKHAVTGLFRSLRTLSHRQHLRQGVRVNMLCPYFVDTPILANEAMALLAGMALARLEDVVDAATRFMADDGYGGGGGDGSSSSGSGRISGRALVVGPRLSLLKGKNGGEEGGDVVRDLTAREDDDGDNDVVLVDEDLRRGRGQAVWECYAHDYDTVDFFIRRYIRVLNTVAAVRGWIGWARDLYHALFVRRNPDSSSRVG